MVSYGLFLFFILCSGVFVPHVVTEVKSSYPSGVLLNSTIPILTIVKQNGGFPSVCYRLGEIEWDEESWSLFMEEICENIVKNREHNLLKQRRKQSVVVIGGGPVGLMSAITAYRNGADAVVLEKRVKYDRNVWFDISSRPWGQGLEFLESWGFLHMQDDLGDLLEYDPEDTVVHVQCRGLERFLAHVAAILELDVRYGTVFQSIEDAEGTITVASVEDDTQKKRVHFDLLIATDGLRSSARKQLGLHSLGAPGHPVAQLSVILDFKECPKKRDDFEPWDISKHVEGVVLIFRRFFADECHMQILFTEESARQLRQQAGKKHHHQSSNPDIPVPWDLVWRVCNASITPVFAELSQLQANIVRVEAVDIYINRTTEGTLQMPSGRTAVILGDAFMSAHYRLGIGINNALNMMGNLGVFLRKMGRYESVEERKAIIREKSALDLQHVLRMWKQQVKTMWLETYCGYHLFFEHSATSAGEKKNGEEEEEEEEGEKKGTSTDKNPYTLRYEELIDPNPLFTLKKLVNGTFEKISYEEGIKACEEKVGRKAPWKSELDLEEGL